MSVHRAPAIVREYPDGGERWCYVCRKPRQFLLRLHAPGHPSVYGPHSVVSCEACGTPDGDVFPGRARGARHE